MHPFAPHRFVMIALAGTLGCASAAPDPPEQPGLPPLDTVQPVPPRPSTATPDPVREAASAARAGAILPNRRIVAFYGNPRSSRMGILGELPPDRMLARLDQEVAAWERADPATPVQPALHLIATVAQGYPGRDRKHRLRMSDSLIERVAGWAESNGWLLFLDVQVGHSSMEA